MKAAVLAALGLSVVAIGSGLTGPRALPAPAAAAAPQAAAAASVHPQLPLWGDTHLHTANSFDAFTAGLRLGPVDALRFARGEGVTVSTGEIARLRRPLDFLVITDHSDAIGVTADLYNTPEDQLADPVLKRWRAGMHEGGKAAYGAFREMVTAASKGTLPPAFADPKRMRETARRVWDGQLEAVERYNEPGRFTALIGFEYSLQPNGNTLHRNVIFRDGAERASQVLPFPSDGQKGPEALWDYMDNYERKTGGKALAIPHNSNLSNGQAFMLTQADGGPMSADAARRRALREPVVEVTQYKGDSESHPSLSRNDEFAGFGDAGWENGNAPLTALKQPGMQGGEYIREALKRGLLIERSTGANPYAFGLIGSTDSHSALSAADEDNFYGKFSNEGPGMGRMTAVVNPGIKQTRLGWQYEAGGMAAVWATANTREAIFDALSRREVYATTGSRMTVRMFGGWDFSRRDLAGDWVNTGYARGVPMGAYLRSGKGAPSFMVSALKDPIGANLDRIQIVKGWVDGKGTAHEKVFDVVWSDPGRRRLAKGRLTPVGDTVDLGTATYRNTIGAPALSTVWRDPTFRSGERAFYYARVLEIPTPRWTAYEVVRYKQPAPDGALLKHQERAYTSPIWYSPRG